MSFLIQENLPDPSNDVPVLNVKPSSQIGLREVVDIVGNLRLRHEGVISFARGSIKDGEIDRIKVQKTGVVRNPVSAGWHMHGGIFAVNISKGSGIPTILARPEDVSLAVVSAIRSNMNGISLLDRALPEFPIAVVDLDEKVVEGQPHRLAEHMERITDVLSNRELTSEEISQALNRLRNLLLDVGDNPARGAQLYHQTMFNIIRESQCRVPKEKTLEMSPRRYDLYAIPPLRVHARSVREGKLYRPPKEQNIFIQMDRNPRIKLYLDPRVFI